MVGEHNIGTCHIGGGLTSGVGRDDLFLEI